MAPYLSVMKNCGYETTGACRFEVGYLKDKKNNTRTLMGTNYYKLILQDGTVFILNTSANTVTKNNITIPRSWTSIFIDINGQKGPNVFGKDLFYYIYRIQEDRTPIGGENNSGKMIPSGANMSREEMLSDCANNGSGCDCTALIMNDGWQIKDDYPW
ncbi:hypothetical protein IKQ26_05115 [bacterium]|nr:hypothetical protein [bacterium]